MNLLSLGRLVLLLDACSVFTSSENAILNHNSRDSLKLCGKKRPCVRKCCPENYVLKNKVCQYSESHKFELQVFRGEKEINKTVTFNVIHNKTCQVGRGLKLSPTGLVQDVFYLQRNGSLFKPNDNVTPWVPFPYYCLETFVFPTGDELSALVCYVPNLLIGDGDEFSILGMIISMPFLLATFLVYALLPEPNLHRRALMSYVATLLMGYILLVSVQLSSEGISDVSCNLLGYLIIFFFTVSFFWMNVMCIDMWLAFRGMRSFGDRKGAERKRFIIYCCYAWGMPLVDILIIFLLNTYGDQTSSYYPAIGIQRCFVGEGLPNFLYFYLLAMLILIINIVLFILTGFKIHKVQRETSVLKHSDSKRHAYEDDKQQYKLYVKLLFAMGVNWITEIISWAIGYFWQETPKAVFYFTDFINATYGVFIFFIFVFKRKIWTSLKKRYYICIGKPHLAHAMSTTRGGTRTSNFSTTETGTSVHTDYRMNEMRNGKPEERALNRH
ncbi:G-protein coupled receptor Mth2 isoform X8 [Leptinotarsa decemlineata]|uniref:G-protein coupled receptor Mth2 isoform X8 n=1 Tax=Leptinotarsa decemlineata TaxID=7539 RepID=UPI003D304609